VTTGTAAVILAASVTLGVAVPWVVMRILAPSLAEGSTVSNYRGDTVFLGLGIGWLVWAGCAVVAGALFGVLATGSLLTLLPLAGWLALAAFAFGLADDAYGTGRSRGFRGHLRSLASGRLTTGGLKLFGISAASYVAGLSLVAGDGVGYGRRLLLALPVGASIALTANFINLTDLRPGRALKAYLALALVGILSTTLLLGGSFDPRLEPSVPVIEGAALLLFVIGPVVAVWRYDVGGLGMLGDAGANAMGAVAGLLIVAGLPLWALLGYLVLMLALNLVSERISFSKVIDGNRLLTWLDMLGRGGDSGNSSKSSPHDGARAE
jgi:UDP-GlcNAc:undecaprenyl-phosphate/decaprenyl-phosphate GlcNAc-1-phosphate transferase